jgi:hypothetical protein
MNILLFGLVSFALSLTVQLVVWRIRIPVRQAKALLVLFAASPFLLLAALVLASGPFPAVGVLMIPRGPWEILHTALLVGSLTGAWLITYSAVEVDSPSLHIVHAVAAAGDSGIAETELRALFPDELLLYPRIDDLVTDRMVEVDAGAYRLTAKGAWLALLFSVYRRILGLGMGG